MDINLTKKEFYKRIYNIKRFKFVKSVLKSNMQHKNTSTYKHARNVAYSSRERTFDNNLTQLIRHTIEYIKTSHFGKQILSVDYETTKCTKQIVEATPSYTIRERGKIISNNLIPTRNSTISICYNFCIIYIIC